MKKLICVIALLCCVGVLFSADLVLMANQVVALNKNIEDMRELIVRVEKSGLSVTMPLYGVPTDDLEVVLTPVGFQLCKQVILDDIRRQIAATEKELKKYTVSRIGEMEDTGLYISFDYEVGKFTTTALQVEGE